MNYPHVAGLVDGTRLTILSDAGLTMDGYHWFHVAWRTGSGYEWGGILCSDDTKLNGIFSVCGGR